VFARSGWSQTICVPEGEAVNSDLILTRTAESAEFLPLPQNQTIALMEECASPGCSADSAPHSNIFQHLATTIVAQDSADMEVRPDAVIDA
jgi:hypothetical protein